MAMSAIQVIGKENHKVLKDIPDNSVKLDRASVVIANAPTEQIEEVVRDGTSMIIRLQNGEIIIIDNFFSADAHTENSLVLSDATTGHLTWVQFVEAQGNAEPQLVYHAIDSTDALLYQNASGFEAGSAWAWAAVPVTVGGILLWADHHKNDQEKNVPQTQTAHVENTVQVSVRQDATVKVDDANKSEKDKDSSEKTEASDHQSQKNHQTTDTVSQILDSPQTTETMSAVVSSTQADTHVANSYNALDELLSTHTTLV